MARRKRDEAFSRRANLRRRQIEDMDDPQVTGPESNASLLLLGVPEGEMAGAAKETAAKFGPKGFKAAKKVAGTVGEYAKRVLKPILSKSMKGGK